jgi:hypothetical protein
MFSTLFYIFILLFEGLFSRSSEDYNLKIAQLNQQITKHEYVNALRNAKQLKRSSIFINPAIENTIAVLELKIHAINHVSNSISFNSNSITNDILWSHFLALKGNSKEGLKDLHQSIIENGNVDTLVKSYELYAFNFPQNKLKKQQQSTQMIRRSQKINSQEALSLLDLMKKKQKNLIY